jgi:hypothetical protein
MSVTFGTPVAVNYVASGQTNALVMSGVTSGQPIILVWGTLNFNVDTVTIADTFSTPYTWTRIDAGTSGSGYGCETWIGTGGAGTSGTITITTGLTNSQPGSVAIPCIGASTAAGLGAVDVHSMGTNSASTTIASVSLTPTAAGEGAFYVGGQAAFSSPAITASPSSPWTSTAVTWSGATYMSVATEPSPTSGSALTTSWTMNSSQPSFVAGVIVKAASAPVNTGAMFAVL